MCIVLLTTAHPSYALIVIDNRDEYILRPTSRPHWWTSSPETNGNGPKTNGHDNAQQILSSRDLQRAERGTWLGVTKSGKFAVLTNYRETDTGDPSHPVHGLRSRGAMVTSWLTSPDRETTADFVQRMVSDGSVKGVGGFSLIAGKLRKQARKGGPVSQPELQPMAIISNRNEHTSQVPWIGCERDQVYGLSNTVYAAPSSWPKVQQGQKMLRAVIQESLEKSLPESELVSRLFDILDTDTLPTKPDASFEEHLLQLKHSIFIPPVGDEHHRLAMREATARGKGQDVLDSAEAIVLEERPDQAQVSGFMTGLYGTQRQTVILVDWEGNVTYTERALWDGNGNPIERGEGDISIKFNIEGWEDV